jgi:hypothetical protein
MLLGHGIIVMAILMPAAVLFFCHSLSWSERVVLGTDLWR